MHEGLQCRAKVAETHATECASHAGEAHASGTIERCAACGDGMVLGRQLHVLLPGLRRYVLLRLLRKRAGRLHERRLRTVELPQQPAGLVSQLRA